jgi:hypothetical protein
MEEYGEEYAVPGGIYRGEPPWAFFKSSWTVDKQSKMPMVAVSGSPTGLQWVYVKAETSDGLRPLLKFQQHTQGT